MKLAVLAAAIIPAIAFATLTYNITEALAPGELDKYHCLTTTKWNERIPTCVQSCQIQANSHNGCAYDDFACHCVNYQTFSDIIEPCVFPPALGGHGTCTFAELGEVRSLITDMCNFFNATLYAGYAGCPIPLSPQRTLATVAKEPVKVSY